MVILLAVNALCFLFLAIIWGKNRINLLIKIVLFLLAAANAVMALIEAGFMIAP